MCVLGGRVVGVWVLMVGEMVVDVVMVGKMCPRLVDYALAVDTGVGTQLILSSGSYSWVIAG